MTKLPATAGAAAAAGAALVLAACVPALDWRQSRPDGSGVAMLFPCRPERHERPVQVADRALRMQLHSCNAARGTFSLAVVEGAEPTGVTELLAALRAQAVANVGAVATPLVSRQIAGATPNPASGQIRISGQRPDGRRVVGQASFFVKGLRLYQATAIGVDEPLDEQTLETFFGAIDLS